MEIWLFALRMPEALFWDEMTPARLCSLYDAHFRAQHQAGRSQSSQTGENVSLFSYLTGMGG